MTDPPSRSTRATHPLLGAFPLAVMTLATFLVLFTVMMARLRAGADPALHAGTVSALPANRTATGAVRTRTSGAGPSAALATPVAATGEPSAGSAAVVTRASGAPGTAEVGDE